jgi:hypothetical protein
MPVAACTSPSTPSVHDDRHGFVPVTGASGEPPTHAARALTLPQPDHTAFAAPSHARRKI